MYWFENNLESKIKSLSFSLKYSKEKYLFSYFIFVSDTNSTK